MYDCRDNNAQTSSLCIQMEFPYSFSRKANSVAKNAKVVQFPLRLAFGATAHKVQGQSVLKPNLLSVDLVSVREGAQG